MTDRIEKEIEYWEWMLKEDAKSYEETKSLFYSGRASATKQFIRKLKMLLRTAIEEEAERK